MLFDNGRNARQIGRFTVPIGHIDFFPNGGMIQPGCENSTDGNPLTLFSTILVLHHSSFCYIMIGCCSHCRAVGLFEESITSQVGFRAVECPTWDDYLSGSCNNNKAVLMGEPVPIPYVYFCTNCSANDIYTLPCAI